VYGVERDVRDSDRAGKSFLADAALSARLLIPREDAFFDYCGLQSGGDSRNPLLMVLYVADWPIPQARPERPKARLCDKQACLERGECEPGPQNMHGLISMINAAPV